MADAKERSADPAARCMIDCACEAGISTAWDRLESQEPQCGFGELGVCCRHCSMGPCRINPFGRSPQAGVCGATADTIVARGLLRHICSGTAAHSDHARTLVQALLLAAEGTSDAYSIKGPRKLRRLAEEYGILHEDRTDLEVAKDVGQFLLAEFGRQEGYLADVNRAPEQQRRMWEALGVTPRGIDREVTGGLHATSIGADNDPEHLLMTAARTALADGWGGSMIATDVSDVLFGEPNPLRSRVNLGVLKEDEVNILVHGHEPTLSDVVVAATRDPELIAAAQAKGAKGINLAGICCTANEVLMRHGVPIAGNFLHQELAIMTGAVDLMLVDIQCVLPAVADLMKHYHTRVVSTSPKAKLAQGSTHVEFREENAMATAKEIIRIAIDAYGDRDPSKVNIPPYQEPLVAGFTTESIFEILGGKYRPSFRPLNDGIQTGRLRGVAGVIGCNNPKYTQDAAHLAMVKELIANDVLVVQTGCSAIGCAKGGLMAPEAAEKFAGKGLQEICRATGLPPVLHMGSCVDNSRIVTACIEMVREGGIGDSLDKLPVAGAAPEWMSEKAIAIGMYFVASGVSVFIGQSLPVEGGKKVHEMLTKGFEEAFGATWTFEPDPVRAAHLMIDHIDRKRADLGLPGPMFEAPYAPRTAEPELVGAGAAEGSGEGD